MEFETQTHLGPNDIWRLRDIDCAIGAVLFACDGDRIALVRKAPVAGYEYSGLWALPGGLVRGSHERGFWGALEQSLRTRASNEAGFRIENLRPTIGVLGGDYPITQYTVKGTKKATVVVPVVADVVGTCILAPQDKSVDAARWFSVAELSTVSLAPANAVIVYRLAQSQLSVDLAQPHAALAECRANVEAVLGHSPD